VSTDHQPSSAKARDIVVLGASAGGLETLIELFSRLPTTTPAAFFVVLHLPPAYGGDFVGLLSRGSAWRASFANDGALIEKGNVYVAPPDRNMTLERGRIVVEASPRETHHRPSINALFRSAATTYGRRVVGVILTGVLEDGAAGAWEIWRRGGIVIVQDPVEARFPDLPRHVINTVPVDHCAYVHQIADLVAGFATRPHGGPPITGDFRAKVLIVEDERIVARSLEQELQALHYEVTGTVITGKAAVMAAERTRPDVVLMDIRLAGHMHGTEAATLIWQRLQIPVVYLTAYADPETLAAVKRTNAYGYVMKPYEAEEVHVALQLALERRDREAVPPKP